MTRIIETLDEIATMYDAAFVDLWGCMHNGIGLHRFNQGKHPQVPWTEASTT